MMVVTHNLQSMFTQRQLGITDKSRAKSTEKLSSGYKINRAADDAAGLTISEKMRRQIRGLTQASANVQDGVSLAQTADGYLDEVHDMLHRMTELCVKASNDTLTQSDRQAVDEEIGALKEEMSRIFSEANFNTIPLFHVPFTPEIQGYPNGMQVFHLGNGQIGGLEFNNVRYNISELQAKKFLIDSNGVATQDFTAKFQLYDGEVVDVSMKEGDELDRITRNFKWTADDNGISINEKYAADWNEVRDENGRGITDLDNVEPGNYTFTHQGMTITFKVEEKGTITELKDGINGDLATKAASWDVSVGGAQRTYAADIVTTNGNNINVIQVTNSNSDVIAHNYELVANASGIAVKDATLGTQTSYRNWNSFSDQTVPTRDPNNNPIDTNGGYPIKNWGDVNDSNSASDITFDHDATYHFESPDNDLKLKFNFKMADSASLAEVEDSLNVPIAADPVRAPGTLTASAATSYGKIAIEPGEGFLASDFEVQKAYGRNFNSASATLKAEIYLERTLRGADESAKGPYDAGHSVTGRTYVSSEKDTGATTKTLFGLSYQKVEELYWDDELDDGGNPIQDVDEYGNPKFDDGGNPVYKQKQYSRYHYYEIKDSVQTDQYDVKYRSTESWDQEVNLKFTGDLSGNAMNEIPASNTERYSRSIEETRRMTQTYHVYEARELTASEIDDTIKSAAEAVSDAPAAYREGDKTSSYSGYSLLSSGAKTLDSVNWTYYTDKSFQSGTKPEAFDFTFSIQNINQARAIASSSGPVKIGEVDFAANGYATRTFRPNDKGSAISEAQFSKIKLNVPKKSLNIQAGAEEGHIIKMEWSPLNLTICGLSNVNTLTVENARSSIAMVEDGLDLISETRSAFGAYQNRFEHTIANLDNVVENTQAAESLIRDTDMAKETVKHSKESILMQAGAAMLAQANQSRQGILSLLQ